MSDWVAWLRSGRGITLYAACVVGFMTLVIVEGAVVRATGSGAGCGNHWPLCNGDFFPHHPRLATVIEYVHRSLTAVLTWMVVGLIAWTILARPSGHLARRAVVWSGALLVVEAALGAVLVKGGYVEGNASAARVLVQGVHFMNTMLLLAAMTLSWWWMRERDGITFDVRARATAWTALTATLVVGATGSVAALADTLFPSPSLAAGLTADFAAGAPLLIRMRWLHPGAAVVGLAAALWLGKGLPRRLARWLMVLIAVQILLGVSDVLLLAPTWMQTLHLLGANVYWIALVAACSGVLIKASPLRASMP